MINTPNFKTLWPLPKHMVQVCDTCLFVFFFFTHKWLLYCILIWGTSKYCLVFSLTFLPNHEKTNYFRVKRNTSTITYFCDTSQRREGKVVLGVSGANPEHPRPPHWWASMYDRRMVVLNHLLDCCRHWQWHVPLPLVYKH